MVFVYSVVLQVFKQDTRSMIKQKKQDLFVYVFFTKNNYKKFHTQNLLQSITLPQLLLNEIR